MTVKSDSIVSVSFAGGYYMTIEGSPRHESLTRAAHAFDHGDRELAEDLKQEALSRPGCAFEEREKASSPIREEQATRDQIEYEDRIWNGHFRESLK